MYGANAHWNHIHDIVINNCIVLAGKVGSSMNKIVKVFDIIFIVATSLLRNIVDVTLLFANVIIPIFKAGHGHQLTLHNSVGILVDQGKWWKRGKKILGQIWINLLVIKRVVEQCGVERIGGWIFIIGAVAHPWRDCKVGESCRGWICWGVPRGTTSAHTSWHLCRWKPFFCQGSLLRPSLPCARQERRPSPDRVMSWRHWTHYISGGEVSKEAGVGVGR